MPLFYPWTEPTGASTMHCQDCRHGPLVKIPLGKAGIDVPHDSWTLCARLGRRHQARRAGRDYGDLRGAVLTYIQGLTSDRAGSIRLAYWAPLVAFALIAYYGAVACRKDLAKEQAITQ